MKKLTLKEIYNLSMTIEEVGEAFYKQSADFADDEKIKKLFKVLASQEANHKAFYKSLYDNYLQQTQEELEISDNPALIKVIESLQETVFTRKNLDYKISDFKNVYSLIEFAIDIESKVITLFTTMRTYVNPKNIPELDVIINQEKNHLTQLITVRKTVENFK